jgi:hypothetical protein
MTKGKKILIVIGVLGIAVGGFVLTKYLTRNQRKIVGGTIELVEYDTPPVVQELP